MTNRWDAGAAGRATGVAPQQSTHRNSVRIGTPGAALPERPLEYIAREVAAGRQPSQIELESAYRGRERALLADFYNVDAAARELADQINRMSGGQVRAKVVDSSENQGLQKAIEVQRSGRTTKIKLHQLGLNDY